MKKIIKEIFMNKTKKNLISLLLAPIPILSATTIYSMLTMDWNETKYGLTLYSFLIYLVEFIIIFPILIFYKKQTYDYKTCAFIGLLTGFLIPFLILFSQINFTTFDNFISSLSLRTYILGTLLGLIVSISFWTVNKQLNKI